MAAELIFNPSDVLLRAVQANLTYWIEQNNNISKRDQGNLRRVVLFGFGAEETFQNALRLTVQSLPLIETRGDALEWLEIIAQTFNHRNTFSPIDIGKLLNIQGDLAFSCAQYTRAVNFYEKSIGIANNLLNTKILFNAFLGICHSKWGLRQFKSAKEFGNKALKLSAINSDLKIGNAKTYNILGMISFSEKRTGEASGYFQKAKRLYREGKDQAGGMRVENNLAMIDQKNGNFESALKRVNKVINYFNKNNSEVDIVKAEVVRGLLYYQMGALERSKQALLSAIPTEWEVSVSGYHRAWIHLVMGTIELMENNLDLSEAYYLKSLKYWNESNHSEMIIFLNDRLKLF